MLSGGMPPEAVRTVVGHITDEMTQRYYKPAVDTLRRLQERAASSLVLINAEAETPALPAQGNSHTLAIETDEMRYNSDAVH